MQTKDFKQVSKQEFWKVMPPTNTRQSCAIDHTKVIYTVDGVSLGCTQTIYPKEPNTPYSLETYYLREDIK